MSRGEKLREKELSECNRTGNFAFFLNIKRLVVCHNPGSRTANNITLYSIQEHLSGTGFQNFNILPTVTPPPHTDRRFE
jgi:hypothetical protein